MAKLPLLPDFDSHGLLPAGLHRASQEEFARRLGFNTHRLNMIEHGIRPVVAEIRVKGVRRLFVGGSCVPAKPLPGDIDTYVVVADRESSLFWFIGHRFRRWEAIYRVQCFPALRGRSGAGSEAYWRNWFGHEAGGRAKGIVMITL